MVFTTEDRQFMAEAIRLARRGLNTVTPNPAVGSLVVRDGQVIGRGWHQWPGQAHGEINAMNHAREQGHELAGASLYITLEPCCFEGKTAACSEAIIDAGISRVVTAMQDPNPQVAGAGHERLRQAGIEIASGLLSEEAAKLNAGFVKRMQTGLPFVSCKMASSLDGRTAMASGESQWITGTPARALVHALRAQSCAIVTGVDTILRDNPQYTVREDLLGTTVERQPMLVILDSTLRTPTDAAIFDAAAVNQRKIVLVSGEGANSERQVALQARGAQVVELPLAAVGGKSGIDVQAVLQYLGQQQVNHVLLESGATLAGAFLQAGAIDELHCFIAGKLMGSGARPLFELPLANMAEAVTLDIVEVRAVGDDWLFRCKPVKN